MRQRHTRHSDPSLAGPTTQTAVRIPEVQREAIGAAIAGGLPGIHSFTDVVVDALWLWLYETNRPVLAPPKLPQTRFEAEKMMDAEIARSDSNGRPAWSDVDPALLEES